MIVYKEISTSTYIEAARSIASDLTPIKVQTSKLNEQCIITQADIILLLLPLTSHVDRFEIADDDYQPILNFFNRDEIGEATNNRSWFYNITSW